MTRRTWCGVVGAAVALTAAACGGSTSPGGGAAIGISPAAASFLAQQGAASPTPDTLAIANSGTGTLAGLAVGSIAYTTGSSGWLAAALTQTTAPAGLVLTATTTSLAAGTYTATVPLTASAASNSPQSVDVTLTVSAPASTTTLTAAGQSAVFLDTPNVNAVLAVQGGDQYLITVANTDATYTSHEDFTLVGGFTASSPASLAARPKGMSPLPAAREAIAPNEPPGFTPEPGARRDLATLRRMAQSHLGVLEDNRRIYERFGHPAISRALAVPRRPISATVVPTIGTVNKVYVKKSLGGDCTSVDSIGARTVAVGQHVIVLADTNRTSWPASLRPDSSFYQTFADEYDQVTFPHILANVGNPLADDADLSGLGKITVTITPVLNTFGGGIVAFVNGCDFFPFAAGGSQPDLSNETEMFYSWIPGTNGYDVKAWSQLLRGTAAHETKHIVSYTDRILNNSPQFELIWLEEGLAQQSEEIWERHFNQATWKGHATFVQTIACEIDLGAKAPCDAADDKPIALIGSHLPFTFEYLQTESTSNGEGLGLDTPSNYGAGWMIARWATDQYATPDEGTFIKSLINEPTLNGTANLARHTGQTVPLLLTYWNMAMAVFQTPTYTAADVRTTIPSFDLADIFLQGQTGVTCGGNPCGLFTDSGTPVYPVQPTAVSAGSIHQAVSGVPGTSAAYFLLSATSAGTESLQLQSGSGGTLPSGSGFRVGILRVK